MKKLTAYIAGQVSGIPFETAQAHFAEFQTQLEAQGHERLARLTQNPSYVRCGI